MLSPLEITILVLLIICISWYWYTQGQRDYALKCIKAHCQKLNLILLDGYVALNRVTIQPNDNNKLCLVKKYNFEFTVNAEHRYIGYITLIGHAIAHIKLPPYLINDPLIELPHNDNLRVIMSYEAMVTLNDYKK